MICLALIAQLSAAVPARDAAAHSSPDSVVVDRLVRVVQRRIPMRKWRELGPGEALTTAIGELQQAGFFALSPESIVSACGDTGATVNRLAISVRDDGVWRQLVVPDGCQPALPETARRLAALRSVAWAVLAGHPVRVVK